MPYPNVKRVGESHEPDDKRKKTTKKGYNEIPRSAPTAAEVSESFGSLSLSN